MKPSRTLGLLTAVLCVSIAGCGQQRDPSLPALVPVTGTVRLDGQPLANASVYFGSSVAGATGSSAATDQQGKYELTTLHNGVGAPVGQYIVVISKAVQPDGSDLPAGEIDLMSTPHKESLLPRYSDANQTKLTAEVSAGGAVIDFDLTSKP